MCAEAWRIENNEHQPQKSPATLHLPWVKSHFSHLVFDLAAAGARAVALVAAL